MSGMIWRGQLLGQLASLVAGLAILALQLGSCVAVDQGGGLFFGFPPCFCFSALVLYIGNNAGLVAGLAVLATQLLFLLRCFFVLLFIFFVYVFLVLRSSKEGREEARF